mgnify:CR=1 FL=1
MGVREPIKKSSIEKKNRIIKMGFELMCDKGYYNVTCVDIARYAGVSTGIIYQYFNDKRDIFLAGVRNYSNSVMFPMNEVLDTVCFDVSKIDDFISLMIDRFIMSKSAHAQLSAMSCLDNDVANVFHENEMIMTDKIVSILENNNIEIDNSREKTHIIIGLIDNFCHEVVYHKHDNLNYDLMKKEVVSLCVSIFKKKV